MGTRATSRRVPSPVPGNTRHPRKQPRRENVDGVRHRVDNGINWRPVPADFAPWRTNYGFVPRWAATGGRRRHP
ncbi:transposase [Streptomyces sp. NPDC001797]|uniref:transposase n=1 Tax=Streptomyces sp. NPDC001797 TaxID=3364610 RepID=UPI0036B0A373